MVPTDWPPVLLAESLILPKSKLSKALPITERRSAVRIARGERGIWQRRFWEHLIRDEYDFERHFN